MPPLPLPAFHCPQTHSQWQLSMFGIGGVCYGICVSQKARELQSWSNSSFLEHIPAGPVGPRAQAHTHMSEVAVSAKAKSSWETFGCQENGDFQLWWKTVKLDRSEVLNFKTHAKLISNLNFQNRIASCWAVPGCGHSTGVNMLSFKLMGAAFPCKH